VSTPVRARDLYDDDFGGAPLSVCVVMHPVAAALRPWNRTSSAGVDHFIAISRHIADRIRRRYGRDADVSSPHVDA
jgi:hypothetical protein